MSHTNSTANYRLPQFLGTDKPAWLTDVNQAFADIDTTMKANEVSAGQANALATQNASAISTQSGQISTLSTKVTALETAQPTDEAQIETNRQNIATNAQNIVDLDNRMGHTSISGIGDGTATGAIKAVDDKVEAVDGEVGDLADLDTTDKTSIVNAINEVVAGGGGDVSTVRYNNGWIEYTPDGGTTWVQLINTATPVQLLPVMTGNVSAVGTASAQQGSGASTDIDNANAYKAIDGTDPTFSADMGGEDTYCQFEFINSQFVKSIKCEYISYNSSTLGGELTGEYTIDGTTWYQLTPVTVNNHVDKLEYNGVINNTIKAFRFRKTNSTGKFKVYKIEAWN